MTKKELVVKIADETGLTQKNVSKIVECFCDNIVQALENGDSVKIMGFGSFKIKKKAARKGRNPQTGKTIKIPAYAAPVFKYGKNFRERLNNK